MPPTSQRCHLVTRQVIVAGTAEQVAAALAAAEPHREALAERGVLVIPVPCFGNDDGTAAVPPPTDDDLRYVCHARRVRNASTTTLGVCPVAACMHQGLCAGGVQRRCVWQHGVRGLRSRRSLQASLQRRGCMWACAWMAGCVPRGVGAHPGLRLRGSCQRRMAFLVAFLMPLMVVKPDLTECFVVDTLTRIMSVMV